MSISARNVGQRVVRVRCTASVLVVDLLDGRTLSVPLAWYPRLLAASPKQRANWRLSGGGFGLHWPDVDEDLSTEGLLRGAPAASGARAVRPQAFEPHALRLAPGDTVRVHLDASRSMAGRVGRSEEQFEGVIIAMRGSGKRQSMTVRRVAFGVGIERAFPLHSPAIRTIDVVKRAAARKRYRLRDRRGPTPAKERVASV